MSNEIVPKIIFQESNKAFLRKSYQNNFSIKKNFKKWLGEQKRIWKNYKGEF